MFSEQLIKQFEQTQTPFYYYDLELLNKTIQTAKKAALLYGYHLHYALKANSNPKILELISKSGFGADCVSGNELLRALECGFEADQIVFAGVGKADHEIRLAIEHEIFSINCESLQELKVINSLAASLNKTPRIALRINPNVDAKTHRNITTGLVHNKFGISESDLTYIIENRAQFNHVNIEGLHFHIGSQITDLDIFRQLCLVVNEFIAQLSDHNFQIKHINLGGGLGIDYASPEDQIPDFKSYFKIIHDHLKIQTGQTVHLEPGRSIVGQCASIISKVLYVKENANQKTLIIDSGFTELLRPALYQAHHKIINLSSKEKSENYDVAGPICESSDYFGTSIPLPESSRSDLIAILSTGAYGEVMSSMYNLRTPAQRYFSDDFAKNNSSKLELSYDLSGQNHYG